MAFLTIHLAEGLTPAQRRRAARDGPLAVSASRPHRQLLEAAGFVEVTETDYSDEFIEVTRAWSDQWDAHRQAVEELWGPERVAECQRERAASLRSAEAGHLRRSLFTARRR